MVESILKTLQLTALNAMQEAVLHTSPSQDLLLLSPTGSGKTLAFLLAALQQLPAQPVGIQVLVVAPSRELALQIESVFKSMGTGRKVSCSYGGHAVKTEENSLIEPPTVWIGTPGRIAHHIRKRNVAPETIQTLVLDEFDKALEMGFQADMTFIIRSLTTLKRRIYTSATTISPLPDFAQTESLTEVNFLEDRTAAPDLHLQTVLTTGPEKLSTLFSLLCAVGSTSTLVFCNHRDAVERISEVLTTRGLVHTIFHGGLEQPDRERALMKFRNGSSRILIVTDLASRGLDIPEIQSIIHYQMPLTEEAFVHRNGRTARMHASGHAYLLLAEDEKPSYVSIEPEELTLPEYDRLPAEPEWETLYFSAGKKDKISKGDIAGLLMKKGELTKDEVGLIEIKDVGSFAAVKRSKIERVVARISQEKLKGQRIKTAIAR
ncbi:DEAD/DEAH box helicase [Arundinibacter roseus]|uniref:DEAD/DEAH box helicase n=1 Tax=Arundinibacter roseus TaxID=2070510 RepID=A0A4R4KIL9_9BACT|nr:DEAD/DEAH box helicase [Arundinibacter roseus]TDB68060.1 DEAD/DEAH box helicase [Arundinibacter roseus]